MSWNTPVSPGQSAGPRLRNAQWFNSTLESPPPRKRVLKDADRTQIFAYMQQGEAVRYEAVGIKELTDINDSLTHDLITRIDNLNGANWVVALEGGEGTIPVALSGVTRAQVEIVDSNHQFVTYSETNSRLETSFYGKARLLVPGDSENPSLIEIGLSGYASRCKATMNEALTSGCGPFDITSLKGMDGIAPTITEAMNPHRFVADNGATVRVEFVLESAQWEIYQVSCPGTEVC